MKAPISLITRCLHAAVLLTAAGCGGGGGGASTPVEQDRTPPVITLNGAEQMEHEQGTIFVDPGATAQDNVDGVVPVTSEGSVGDAAGKYTLTYRASDAAGNAASTNRTVNVADTTAPLISLLGANPVTYTQGETFTDPGATAQDTVDGAVPVTTSGSVGDAVGTYTLRYSAGDRAGNTAEVSRTVNVEAPTPPDPETEDLLVFYEGSVGASWDRGINAFDEAIGFGDCSNDGGAGCPSIAWEVIADAERGDVLQVTHGASGDLAGLFIATNTPLDVRSFANGNVEFDIRVVSGDSNITMKLDCVFPCTSGEQLLGSRGASGWETVVVPFSTLSAGGLDLRQVNTGIVIWATEATSTVFRIDNVRFTGFDEDATPPPTIGYTLEYHGAGSISDTINPASYRCVYDFGNWIYNAGVVEPGIAGCDTSTGTPTGDPTPRYPQLTGPATDLPTPSHKWWGSVPFLGEMSVGVPNDAAYITPDPLIARVTNRGFRAMGIPPGLDAFTDGFGYTIPDPFSEVFDGVAIGNSAYSDMEAYLKDYSDGAITVQWQSGGQPVMEATFVHGSPYVFVKTLQGEAVLRTLRSDGGEKGTFYQQNNSLGVWTSVAGNTNYFLVTGEGATSFGNVTGDEISVSNTTGEFTLAWLPASGTPNTAMIDFFAARARNVVAAVSIDYSVDRGSNTVTVSHSYQDEFGVLVDTVAGLHPLHWKNSSQAVSSYQARSARGVIRFSATDSFSYDIPAVGVLPTLPVLPGSLDQATLESLISEFVAEGPAAWNPHTDTYWSGKHYGKVAELIAIATAIGMDTEADQLLEWLKAELEDWFTAETSGSLDTLKYFVYDSDWNTLLGLEESFASHQQLNDHHFHYGYFVRAAAEICRQDLGWCGEDQYGPMIELLIRDYAADPDDPRFPTLRNFDAANGFSWASGPANFVRGNNNESTSEAANAYGAIILYGLATGQNDLVDKGTYLHASTAAAYWEYWNNIDGYKGGSADVDNFPAGFGRITTSIIWGDGSAFATWFSGAYAHILGIQGLPANPLILHVGQHADYMVDYVALGLSESSNQKPSGLPDDQWRDLWWNLWSLTDADAVIADYITVNDYEPEAGESKAHTYHWIYTFAELGHLRTGTGAVTANYPAAMAFDNNGQLTYVVYNFKASPLTVTFSDGQIVNATPQAFTIVTN